MSRRACDLTPEQLSRRRETSRRYNRRKTELGLCPSCGKPHTDKHWYCLKCRFSHAKAESVRRAKLRAQGLPCNKRGQNRSPRLCYYQELRQLRRRLGQCVRCGHQNDRLGLSECCACANQRRITLKLKQQAKLRA